MTGLRKRIDYILKHNLLIQKVYKTVMSIFFKTLGLFIRIDEKLILFNGHGRKFNDSPKAIYEYIINNERFKEFKFVWALEKPSEHNIPDATKIKIDTIKYFITALRSKYWISCVNIERGLHFKKNQTIYLNTWHGVPLKLVGNAVSGRKDFDYSNIDFFCYTGKYEKDIYIRDFNVSEKSLILSGLPRNDELYKVTDWKKKQIRQKIGIPENKKVILYVPTWRDSSDKGKNYLIKPPLDIEYLQKELNEEYILLLRTHAYTNKVLGIEFNEFIRDYSTYPEINDLLIISDILISDYSATIFDYAILERPIICFGYDYDQYIDERGFYIDLEKELPNGVTKTQKELIIKIKTMDYQNECQKTAHFKKKFLEVGGDASERCVEHMFSLGKDI